MKPLLEGMMDEIRRIENSGARVETGPVQFGDDWPGIFIRGDDAVCYAAQLGWLLEDMDLLLLRRQLEGLRDLLTQCDLTLRT